MIYVNDLHIIYLTEQYVNRVLKEIRPLITELQLQRVYFWNKTLADQWAVPCEQIYQFFFHGG